LVLKADFSGCFGETHRTTRRTSPHLRANAALATQKNVNVGKVRILPVHTLCSEWPLIPDPPLVNCAANVSFPPILLKKSLFTAGLFEGSV